MSNLKKYRTKKGPLVSIITVVFNGEKYLEQTILSVLNQTYDSIEYIIIDGGSTDGTLDIIKKYENELSFWSSEPDKGLYDAMNKGISKAKGKLIGMINSDDWYENEAVETVMKKFRAYPTKDIFHADRFDVDENGLRRVYKFNKSEFKNKYYDMTYDHTTMFVTSREYEKHVYNPDLTVMSDYQFILEAYLSDKSKFHYIEKAIANYRLDGVSAQIKIGKALKEGFIARKLAGMSLIENLFSVVVRSNIPLLRFIKKEQQKFVGKRDS